MRVIGVVRGRSAGCGAEHRQRECYDCLEAEIGLPRGVGGETVECRRAGGADDD